MLSETTKQMRCAVLVSDYEASDSSFKGYDPVCNVAYHILPDDPNISISLYSISKKSAVKEVLQIINSKKFDLIFNLCGKLVLLADMYKLDGAFDEDRAGTEVVQVLESQGIPYTGGTPDFYNLSKEHQKMIAISSGIKTPEFAFVYNIDEIDDIPTDLSFPMIVKHFNGYSSVAMTTKSRVENLNELRIEVTKMVEEFGGALVEEFILGREFTVLVAENPDDANNPIAFKSIECKFGDGETFKHFDLKWVDFANISWVSVSDSVLDERLSKMCIDLFKSLNGVSYGRIDIRMNEDGELFFLEINPNCGIFYPKNAYGSADFILSNDKLGHKGFIDLIMKSAISRANSKKTAYTVAYRKNLGYGLKATRDLNIGEMIHKLEEAPLNIVSKSYVEKNWNPQMKQWFVQYAYPLSENVYGMWSEKPGDWRPINHSCDPNAHLEGLDLVVRKAISKGDSICIDYSTFCGKSMETFTCRCGEDICRKEVSGKDNEESWILEQYGSHVSDFVYQRINRNF